MAQEELILRYTVKDDGTVKLQKATKQVKELGKEAEKAEKKTSKMAAGMKKMSSAASALGLLGLAAGMGKFGAGTFKAAAQAERLGQATDALAKGIGSSGDAMVSAITSASGETISKLDAMSAANKALMFGLAEDSAAMGDLTKVAVTLGAAMGQTAGKSMEDLTTALGRQSPLILDNLGITLKLSDAYEKFAQSQGIRVEQMTEEQKKQAFINEALAIGQQKVALLGDATVGAAADTERLSAAWSNFQVAFGQLLTSMSGGVGELTGWIDWMSEGAESWGWMLEAAAAQQELTNQTMLAEQAAAGNADAIAALEKIAKTEAAAEREATQARTQGAESARLMGLAARFEAEALQEAELALVQQNAESERWTGLAEESKQLLDELAGGHTLTAREAEAYAEAQDLASEAEANRMETLQGLASGMADFFLGTKDLNEKNIQNEADFHASIASMRADARADTESTAQAQAEKLAEIEQQRADKIAWVQTGSHARTAEENAAALGHWNSHFDKLVTTTNDKYGEQTAAIAANLAEQQAAQAAAREQEAAEYEAHLEELKLKAALGALETTGQLGELTGGLATSAGEAMDLINAGIIPVTEEMGGLIQGTLEGMATKSEEASAIAAENQAILKEAYAGTLEPMTAQNDMLAVGMPESAALNTEAMGVMAEGMQIGFEETMVSSDTTNEAIAKIGTVTLPAVEKQSDVTTQAMVTHFGRVGKAALKAGDEIEKGMKKGIKVLESLAKRAEIAAKAFEKLADAARQAASAAASASAASSTGGANFQHGTPPGGFTVPPGFPNDSFRIGATSGERVTVQTPQQQGNTFNLNVNSSLPSAGVVNDFRLMEALAG